MDEQASGRLERTGARARFLLGYGTEGTSAESTGGPRPPDSADAILIARRISQHSSVEAAAASTIAAEIVARARGAMAKLEAASDGVLTDDDALSLESVMHVRGRPALRLFDQRLESLEQYPGSELWQTFIADYEDLIVNAAASTGAAIVTAFDSGNPPWLQGSAWLIANHRVVTNRHVLVSDRMNLLELGDGSTMRLRSGHSIAIEFAADDRSPAAKIRRRVLEILYVSGQGDPVDIAVLAIEPIMERTPLKLARIQMASRNLFVVGHPAPMGSTPDAVKAVFGNPDGKKRVSFGKRLDVPAPDGDIIYDASSIGGYSGGPVVGISDGTVAGLHYYGDPIGGNRAVGADTIRAHAAYGYW